VKSIALLIAAAVIAVGSKFVIRIKGKHIFNPTNGAIVAMMLLSNRVWSRRAVGKSPSSIPDHLHRGLVVNRAARSDVTYTFIIFWSALVIGRSLYVGEPLTIRFNRLESGALLLFTFS